MQHVLTGRALETSPVFVVMVGARACAFPLHHVAETMRPLPIESVAGTPSFVRGVSVIRGVPTPVVDLKALLENSANTLQTLEAMTQNSPTTTFNNMAVQDALRAESELGYWVESGRYWEKYEQFDSHKLQEIDALWLRTVSESVCS
jgi:chemotaxis signal transduction protein